MRDYKVEQNYRDLRLLTIGEGASEILRLAIAKYLGEPGFGGEDLIPSLESLESRAGLSGGAPSSPARTSLQAFQLAGHSFQIALERIKQAEAAGDLSSGSQSNAIKTADLGTRLWVAGQVIHSLGQLVNCGTASARISSLAESFLLKASLETCHQAMELLRAHGLTDASLLTNYSAVLEIAARNRPAEPLLLLDAEGA
jgi:alkylation response protein AidB-like acyl-CoA dehydrogenase